MENKDGSKRPHNSAHGSAPPPGAATHDNDHTNANTLRNWHGATAIPRQRAPMMYPYPTNPLLLTGYQWRQSMFGMHPQQQHPPPPPPRQAPNGNSLAATKTLTSTDQVSNKIGELQRQEHGLNNDKMPHRPPPQPPQAKPAGINAGGNNTTTNGTVGSTSVASRPLVSRAPAAKKSTTSSQLPLVARAPSTNASDASSRHQTQSRGDKVQHSPNGTNTRLQPLHDLQVLKLINPHDSPLFVSWYKQLSKNVMAVLSSLDFFVLMRPHEASRNPTSQFLRNTWKWTLYGNEVPDNEAFATGLCCTACLASRSVRRLDFCQFVDHDDDEQLFHAGMKLYHHVKNCPRAKNLTTDFKNKKFSVENSSDALALKAFANWWYEHIHEGDPLGKGFMIPSPSLHSRESVPNAIENYAQFEKDCCQALEDMEAALTQGCRGKSKCQVLASDLTIVPSEGAPLYPFFLLLLELIEIVRVTKENPGNHATLLAKHGANSLVLFQCNCCHGASCEGKGSGSTTSSKDLPYVVFRSASNDEKTTFTCDLINLAFHHFRSCPKVSRNDKERIRRVMPRPGKDDFNSFTAFLQARFAEWTQYVNKELEFVRTIQSVAPSSASLWRPMNCFAGSDSMRSVYATPTRKRAPVSLPDNASDYDVLQGFDGDQEYIGNRRFRKLVGSLRNRFLSNPAGQEKVVKALYDIVNRKGGTFRKLDSDGIWRDMSRFEVVEICRTALENGFASLLAPPHRYCPRPGGNVLETEVSPRYDLLSDRKREAIVIARPSDDDEQQSSPTRKRQRSEYV